ncbi:uncharacterized protein AB675_3376 [Cyphellophora attinorum]|uniref:gamma-glutamylcyclotransferase n=1 Tax=Cyphellophora attinorum TaxID=1664694 RepID=A0A0N1NYT4_9EURO|nr:uncharacterized protein AB675_3376 [Phialophora attinorum]KPI39723.1 hypothetical protein AB675_3376 [Phialophora attinorum]
MTTDSGSCAMAAAHEWLASQTQPSQRKSTQIPSSRSIPQICPSRLHTTEPARPLDIATIQNTLQTTPETKETVLYLAYGSNLSDETFLGARGIRPLSQINVLVPEVVMTFDLPGIAYKEPCFANIRYRNAPAYPATTDGPKQNTNEYHKDRWHKPLVGVVYEVTLKDYAHIIATEGGGAGYQDVLVDCYTLDRNPRLAVPEFPQNAPFKAHTLFDPAGQHRADPSYAQPSARYLKLITDGAMEKGLPYEYQDYLHQIRPYRVTTTPQKIGQLFFLAFWGPIFMALIKFGGVLFAGKDGRYPAWLATVMHVCFGAAWTSYDKVFKPTFGDGERTIGETDDDLNEKAPLIRDVIERYGVGGRMGGQMQDDSAVGPKSADDDLLLQDYQMRLRLLEQQNKTRLMMARQEQDNQVDRDDAPMAGMGGTGIGGDGV